MVDEEKKEKPEIKVASKEEVDKVKEEIKKETIPESNSLIDEANKVNKARLEIIEREEKLQTRKEKLHAEQLISGTAVNQTDGKKEETDKEYSDRLLRNEL